MRSLLPHHCNRGRGCCSACAAADRKSTTRSRARDRRLPVGTRQGIHRRVRSRGGSCPGCCTAALAARHCPVLRRSLRRLPQTIRVSQDGESERRREPGVALPLRRARRVAATGTRGAPASGARSAITDARRSTRCSRGRSPLTPYSRREGNRSRHVSSPSCMWACTTRPLATRQRALRTSKRPPPTNSHAAGGYMHRVATLHPLLTGRKP